eukprot:5023312-Amphidinium_carterae.1
MNAPARLSTLPLEECGAKSEPTKRETCVRCQAEPEDLSHILFRCPHWHKERREVELPADDDTTPPCVKLHGILAAPRVPPVITQEPVLVYRTGVLMVWTDGSGRHSADPHHRRCGVGYYSNYTDAQEHVWFPLPGLIDNRSTEPNSLLSSGP